LGPFGGVDGVHFESEHALDALEVHAGYLHEDASARGLDIETGLGDPQFVDVKDQAIEVPSGTYAQGSAGSLIFG